MAGDVVEEATLRTGQRSCRRRRWGVDRNGVIVMKHWMPNRCLGPVVVWRDAEDVVAKRLCGER